MKRRNRKKNIKKPDEQYLMHMSKKDLDLKDENEEKNNKADIL